MRNFVDEFNVKLDKSNEYENVTDYEAFPNKNLLDELRNKIIQNLIDNNITKSENNEDYIKNEIDKNNYVGLSDKYKELSIS